MGKHTFSEYIEDELPKKRLLQQNQILPRSAMTSKPGLNSPLGFFLRKGIAQYNASLRIRDRKKIEETLLKKESPSVPDSPQDGKEKTEEAVPTRESRPVIGTPLLFPKVGAWHDKPVWMFQHRIGMLKTLRELHQEQSIALDRSVQQEWKRLRQIRSSSEIKELEQKVTRARGTQVKPGRNCDDDEWRVRLEEKRMIGAPQNVRKVRSSPDQSEKVTLQ